MMQKRAWRKSFKCWGTKREHRHSCTKLESLKRAFNECFWMEDEGCYAFGLDPDKKQITSIASNAGQCLWSGIVDQNKAVCTVKRLLQEDMWSGWGIRTLSTTNGAYDPFAYQRGSIWPQDNGIIVGWLQTLWDGE